MPGLWGMRSGMCSSGHMVLMGAGQNKPGSMRPLLSLFGRMPSRCNCGEGFLTTKHGNRVKGKNLGKG
jgi:hypothetical protein